MQIHIRAVAVFTLVLAVAALLQFSGGAGQAQLQTDVIEPDVVEALQTNDEVSVMISLVPPAVALADVSISEVQENTAERQAGVLSALDGPDFTMVYKYSVVPALAGRITQSGVQKLDGHPDVVQVALDRQYEAGLAESIPLIHADDGGLSFLGFDGSGVTVAVFDSGIDTDHPDLVSSILGGKCFLAGNASDCPSGTFDYEDDWDPVYHGTAVSGVIASDGGNGLAAPGVAPGANIFTYKIIGGTTQRWGVSDLTAGLNDILDPATFPRQADIDLINMSLQSIVNYGPIDCPQNAGLNLALNLLLLNGTVIIGITGNQGNKTAISFPGCLLTVVAVGAVTDRVYATFNWGPCIDEAPTPDLAICFSNASELLELMGPGASILTTSADADRVEEVAGTSIAAPHVVGVAALLKQADPGINPFQLIHELKSTGAWITDDFDPTNVWITPRVDARVALVTPNGQDFDQDGCTNGQEFGDNPNAGGVRNPLYFWDYYDVWTHPASNPAILTRDGFVTLADILAVAAHFGPSVSFLTKEDYRSNALTEPTSDADKNAAYDRGPSIGPNPWDKGPPDGTIAIDDDILAVAAQFGHTCG